MNSFSLDLHPIRLQIERKVGRKIMAYIFPQNIPADVVAKPPVATTPKPSGGSIPGHKPRSSIGAGAGAGIGIGLGIVGIPRASMDNTSLESTSPRPRTLKKRATSHSNLKEFATTSTSNAGTDTGAGHRPIPKSRSSHALRADAKSSAGTLSSKTGARTAPARPGTSEKDKEKEREREAQAKDDANEMRVRASMNRSFVLVRVSGYVLDPYHSRVIPY